MGKYDDIINLPHHVSPTRPHMSLYDRAAQFSPFAALTGHDAAIQEAGRLTQEERLQAEDAAEDIDLKLRQLAMQSDPEAEVDYFLPDEIKQGGKYVTAKGRIKKIDEFSKRLIFEDGRQIPFRYIRDITIC